jgi:hypothetical protein
VQFSLFFPFSDLSCLLACSTGTENVLEALGLCVGHLVLLETVLIWDLVKLGVAYVSHLQ